MSKTENIYAEYDIKIVPGDMLRATKFPTSGPRSHAALSLQSSMYPVTVMKHCDALPIEHRRTLFLE